MKSSIPDIIPQNVSDRRLNAQARTCRDSGSRLATGSTRRPGFLRKALGSCGSRIFCGGWRTFAIAAALLLATGTGCETLQETTLEADRGVYFEAHRFLRIGHTTRADVLRKYGKPDYILRDRGAEIWYYRTREAVVVNAYSGTTVGTESAMLTGRPGFSRVVERVRGMDIAFGPDGIVRTYRVYRLAPPPPANARPVGDVDLRENPAGAPPASAGGQPDVSRQAGDVSE